MKLEWYNAGVRLWYHCRLPSAETAQGLHCFITVRGPWFSISHNFNSGFPRLFHFYNPVLVGVTQIPLLFGSDLVPRLRNLMPWMSCRPRFYYLFIYFLFLFFFLDTSDAVSATDLLCFLELLAVGVRVSLFVHLSLFEGGATAEAAFRCFLG